MVLSYQTMVVAVRHFFSPTIEAVYNIWHEWSVRWSKYTIVDLINNDKPSYHDCNFRKSILSNSLIRCLYSSWLESSCLSTYFLSYWIHYRSQTMSVWQINSWIHCLYLSWMDSSLRLHIFYIISVLRNNHSPPTVSVTVELVKLSSLKLVNTFFAYVMNGVFYFNTNNICDLNNSHTPPFMSIQSNIYCLKLLNMSVLFVM